MSTGALTILLITCFVVTIAIGFIKNVNIGILGFFFAIIIAMLNGLGFNDVLSGFPTTVILTIFSVQLFFGFAIENGSINYLAKQLLYLFKGVPKILPFAFFIMAAVLGGIGGSSMVIFSCSVAIPVGVASGIKAYETGAICLLGTQVGSYLPWGTHGTTARSIIEGMNDGVWAESALAINWRWVFISVITYLVVIVCYYIFFKNYKLKSVEGVEKPETPTSIQKKNLILIAIVLALIVFVPMINKAVSYSWLKNFTRICAVGPLCIIGTVINILLGLGNEVEILKKRVNWRILTMIFGMGMLLSLATKLGVVEYLGEAAQTLPPAMIAPLFLLIAGCMSLFSSSLSVVYPTLLPIAGTVATNLGLNPVLLMSVIVIGAATTAMSPLSSGGGHVIAATTEEACEPQTMFTRMFTIAVVTMLILFVLCLVGVFGIFSI